MSEAGDSQSSTKKAPIRVRQLLPDDEGRWQALFKAYVAFYGATISDDVVTRTWQRLRGGEDNLFAFVAELPSRSIEHGHDIVGIVHAVSHASTWSSTPYCYLEDLYVDRQARGFGVGRALIEAVYKEADALGCTRTYWATKADNVTARQFYDRIADVSPFVQYRRPQR